MCAMDLLFRPMYAEEIPFWYHTLLAEAFVETERKPLDDILSLIADHRYELWGLFSGTEMLGYAAIWKKDGIPLVLLDYLGVAEAHRNAGLGARILSLLRSQGRLTVTEAELPVPGDGEAQNQLRLRRIRFYQRCGYRPLYPMATCGMAWQALVSDEEAPIGQVMAWHRALYGPERTDVQIPLAPGDIPAPPYWMK
ncbi:MAG: GNAT family N-acetyltransferase [Clostridia bacterium]|nr:GNAT family N-acetyltransferase [Clostridia bacterium]